MNNFANNLTIYFEIFKKINYWIENNDVFINIDRLIQIKFFDNFHFDDIAINVSKILYRNARV